MEGSKQRSGRRKTLSSVDLENFLEDLSHADSAPSGTKLHPASRQSTQGSFGGGDDENARPNSNSCSAEGSADVCQGFSLPTSKESLAPTAPPQIDVLPYSSRGLEDLIREFSRIKKEPGSTYNDMCEIGRDILNRTNYKLVPSRSIFPEKFPLPAASLEAKRALLVSLSPMLGEVEAQRQADVAACEWFTRCKVGKGKSRWSSYEYYDIDANKIVTVEEYERRYLRFIHQNKATHVHERASAPVPLPDAVLEPAGMNGATPSPDDSFDEEDGDAVHGSQGNQGARLAGRRKTMSPATVRAMLLLEVDEGGAKIESEASSSSDEDETSGGVDSSPVQQQQEGAVESSVSVMTTNDPAASLSPLLTFSPFVEQSEEQQEQQRWAVPARSKARLSLDADFMDLVMSMPETAAEQCQGEGGDESSPVPIHAEERVVDEAEQDVEDAHDTLEIAKEKAMARLNVRFEMMRWKYGWEICSFEAAEKGRTRLKAISGKL